MVFLRSYSIHLTDAVKEQNKEIEIFDVFQKLGEKGMLVLDCEWKT